MIFCAVVFPFYGNLLSAHEHGNSIPTARLQRCLAKVVRFELEILYFIHRWSRRGFPATIIIQLLSFRSLSLIHFWWWWKHFREGKEFIHLFPSISNFSWPKIKVERTGEFIYDQNLPSLHFICSKTLGQNNKVEASEEKEKVEDVVDHKHKKTEKKHQKNGKGKER